MQNEMRVILNPDDGFTAFGSGLRQVEEQELWKGVGGETERQTEKRK